MASLATVLNIAASNTAASITAASIKSWLYRFAILALGCLTPMPLLAAAGDLDCTFGAGGIVNQDLGTAEAARDASLQSGGRIVTLGNSGDVIRLSRFGPNGTVDPAFGTSGTVAHTFPGLSFSDALAIDSADRIVIAGRISMSGDTEAFVARFTPDGAVDSSFGGGDGWLSFDWTTATTNTGLDTAGAIAADSSDRLVIGGWTDSNGPTFNPSDRNMAVARLTATGGLDGTFGTGGIAIASSPGTSNDDDLRALKIDGAGRIVAIGSTFHPNPSNSGPRNAILARWTPAGALDTTFDGNGVLILDLSGAGTDDFGIDLDLDSSGRIVALGQGTDDPLLARLNTNGSLDLTFSGDGLLQQSFVGGQDVAEHVLIQADDKPLVTGWPIVGTGFHMAIMRFSVAGILDNSWGGTGVVTTSVAFNERIYSAILQPDQRLVVAGGLDNDSNFVMARYLNDADTITTTVSTITSDLPDPSAVDASVSVSVLVTANSGALAPTGNVMVGDGVNDCTLALTPASGTSASGSCALSLSTLGNRTLTASYQGNTSFCTSEDTEPHLVVPPTTTTAITADTPDPSMLGQAVAISYSVTSSSGSPSGSVTVTDGVDSCVGTVVAGSCNLALTTVGARSLTATYGGDATFPSSVSAPEPHLVELAETSIFISSDFPDPSVVGQSVNVGYRIAAGGLAMGQPAMGEPAMGGPTGNVTVTDGVDSCTATVDAGACSITLTTIGARSLIATYEGDAFFSGSVSPPETHQVEPATTTTTISSDAPDPSAIGQLVTIEYSVAVNAPGAGTPTGNVTITDGVDACSATVAAGTCDMSFSTAGNRSLTATYEGDISFASSVSVAEPHQVDPAETTTSITADDPDPSVVGQPVTVSYSLTINAPGAGNPTGSVTISDGVDACTATVAAGSCDITFSTAGNRSLTATYEGDDSFSNSVSETEAHQVDQAETTTNITADDPDPSAVGQPVTVSYSVIVNAPGAGTPTGNVTISDGVDTCTATVPAGSCIITLSTVGNRLLTATYQGDASFAGSISAPESHEVGLAATTTTLISHIPNPSVFGQTVTMAYSVSSISPGTPSGSVIVSDGVDSCTATVTAGSCELAFTTVGVRVITAAYSGDSFFSGSSSETEEHTVQEVPTATTIVSITPNPAPVDTQVMVMFVVDALRPEGALLPGDPGPTGLVTVDDGAGNGCSAPVLEAGCSFEVSAAGQFTITASYPGDGSYGPSQAIAEQDLEVLGPSAVEVPALDHLGLLFFSLLLAAAAMKGLRKKYI